VAAVDLRRILRAAGRAKTILVDEEREKLQGSLRAYMNAVWRLIEPKRDFVPGWHIDAILEHLEAAFRGQINELVINIPPRCIKSTLTCVIGPTWVWSWAPEYRLLTTSYGLNLALRDASRSRKLLNSPWYQETFPSTRLEPSQRAKGRYETTAGGWRVAGSTAGIGTGEGGQAILVDDPLKAGDADSEVKRQEVIDWWSETLPTRLDDPKHGTKIVIMQRLHDMDLTGFILAEKSPETVHLMLPMRFDPARCCKTRWFIDPRTTKGELLWPERFAEKDVDRLERRMSPRAVSAQLDQLPTVAGGAIFKRDWWQVWTTPKAPECHAVFVSFDPAMKEGQEGSRWAATVWGVFRHAVDTRPLPAADGKITAVTFAEVDKAGAADWHAILLDSWAEHYDYPTAKRRLLETVKEWTLDGVPPDYVLVEDKAAGPILIRELNDAGVAGVMGYNPGRQSKLQRAHQVSDLWYTGRMWALGRRMPGGERSSLIFQAQAEEVIKELALFPNGQHDDLVDSCTQAAGLLRDLGYLRIDTDIDEVDIPDREPHREPIYG
jgi:phage terminase large subunit-like protein